MQIYKKSEKKKNNKASGSRREKNFGRRDDKNVRKTSNGSQRKNKSSYGAVKSKKDKNKISRSIP